MTQAGFSRQSSASLLLWDIHPLEVKLQQFLLQRGRTTVQRQSFKVGLICGMMAEGAGLGA